MTDIERAKKLLRESGATLVLCKGNATYQSRKTGIAPMLDFLESGTDLRGFSAADKIVGKAAALLFSYAGVKEVYGEVTGKKAADVLSSRGIALSVGAWTEEIINRAGTDPCPMERAVAGVSDPAEALAAIRQALTRLKEAREDQA